MVSINHIWIPETDYVIPKSINVGGVEDFSINC